MKKDWGVACLFLGVGTVPASSRRMQLWRLAAEGVPGESQGPVHRDNDIYTDCVNLVYVLIHNYFE